MPSRRLVHRQTERKHCPVYAGSLGLAQPFPLGDPQRSGSFLERGLSIPADSERGKAGTKRQLTLGPPAEVAQETVGSSYSSSPSLLMS